MRAHRRLAPVTAVALACMVHLAGTLTRDPHLPKTRRLRKRLAAVEADTTRLEGEAERLRALVAATATPLGAESVVRDELGWIRPGERLLLPAPAALYSEHAAHAKTARDG